jgi:hypothetical protein
VEWLARGERAIGETYSEAYNNAYIQYHHTPGKHFRTYTSESLRMVSSSCSHSSSPISGGVDRQMIENSKGQRLHK